MRKARHEVCRCEYTKSLHENFRALCVCSVDIWRDEKFRALCVCSVDIWRACMRNQVHYVCVKCRALCVSKVDIWRACMRNEVHYVCVCKVDTWRARKPTAQTHSWHSSEKTLWYACLVQVQGGSQHKRLDAWYTCMHMNDRNTTWQDCFCVYLNIYVTIRMRECARISRIPFGRNATTGTTLTTFRRCFNMNGMDTIRQEWLRRYLNMYSTIRMREWAGYLLAVMLLHVPH